MWLSGKESACNAGDAGDVGSIPGSRKSPGEENGNPVQYSCLKNPIGKGAWQATVQGDTESETSEQAHMLKTLLYLCSSLLILLSFSEKWIFGFSSLESDTLVLSGPQILVGLLWEQFLNLLASSHHPGCLY